MDAIYKVLEQSQSPDQAGFRPGCSCDNSLFTILLIVEKMAEFRMPLWMCAVDYTEAFDSVKHDAIWDSLKTQGVDDAYISLLASLYKGQSGQIVGNATSKAFQIQKGTKQGDPLSPTLFNAVLEQIRQAIQPKWRRRGWGIQLGANDDDILCKLRFADDILLIATSKSQLPRKLSDWIAEARKVGLAVHPDKTKVLSNQDAGDLDHMKIERLEIEVLPRGKSTIYV